MKWGKPQDCAMENTWRGAKPKNDVSVEREMHGKDIDTGVK